MNAKHTIIVVVGLSVACLIAWQLSKLDQAEIEYGGQTSAVNGDLPQEERGISDTNAIQDVPTESPRLVVADQNDRNVSDLISEISPSSYEFFSGRSVTFIELFRGEIGSVRAEEIENGNPESIVQLLRKHSELTGAYDGLVLEIKVVRSVGDGHSVDFSQSIDGIRVDENLRISFDESGTVIRLSSVLVNPETVISGYPVQQNEAIIHAKNALALYIGDVIDQIDVYPLPVPVPSPFDSPARFLKPVDKDSAPKSYWKIAMTPRGSSASYVAKVDAQTGETEVLTTAVYFETIVCEEEETIYLDCRDIPHFPAPPPRSSRET